MLWQPRTLLLVCFQITDLCVCEYMRVCTRDCEYMHVCMFLWTYVAFEKGHLSIHSWWDSHSPGRATLDGQVLR